MQSLVGAQSVQRRKRLLATIAGTSIRFVLGVDPEVDFEGVRRQEGLSAPGCLTAELVLPSVRLEVRTQVAGGAVGPFAALVGAVETTGSSRVSLGIRCLYGECGVTWFFWHLHS